LVLLECSQYQSVVLAGVCWNNNRIWHYFIVSILGQISRTVAEYPNVVLLNLALEEMRSIQFAVMKLQFGLLQSDRMLLGNFVSITRPWIPRNVPSEPLV
jgi:hypothetical protein